MLFLLLWKTEIQNFIVYVQLIYKFIYQWDDQNTKTFQCLENNH